MKKFLLYLSILAEVACTTKIAEPSAGETLGEIYVSAQSGAKSVLVNLDGLWRVRSLSDWMSVDPNGGNGKSAFTIYYGSNESDYANTNNTRKGTVLVENLETMVADTLYLLQQGIPDGVEHSEMRTGSYIEFADINLTRLQILYANLQGCKQEDINSYIKGADAQLLGLVLDESSSISTDYATETYGNLAFVNKSGYPMTAIASSDCPTSIVVDIDGILCQVSDFGKELPDGASRFDQAERLLSTAYCAPGHGKRWIIGGSFYYYSVMESNYPNTPSWYPSNPHDPSFDADRHMQSNNLVDCVWSASRQFNPTFNDAGKTWRADYIYASNSVWNAAVLSSVEEPTIKNASHKMLNLILKYRNDED